MTVSPPKPSSAAGSVRAAFLPAVMCRMCRDVYVAHLLDNGRCARCIENGRLQGQEMTRRHVLRWRDEYRKESGL